MKIGLDLDEVIVEFARGYLNLYNQKYNKNVKFEEIFSYNLWEPLRISRKEAFDLADDYYDSESFDNIKLVDGAKQGLEKLAHNNELLIVTSRPIYVQHKTEEFLQRTFPEVPIDVVYSGDVFNSQGKTKANICENLGLSWFVEDREEYALECAERGIKVLLFDKPWNRNGQLHKNITRVFSWQHILEEIIRG